VDMSTLVIVGSSQTRVQDRPGGPIVFTPRHYGEPGAAAGAVGGRRIPPAAPAGDDQAP
jgi:hypothetical protein